MDLPIRVFWLMSECIPRLQAEKDVRALDVAVASQSAEGMEQIRERLVLELDAAPDGPQPINEERDEEGFNELKALQNIGVVDGG